METTDVIEVNARCERCGKEFKARIERGATVNFYDLRVCDDCRTGKRTAPGPTEIK